MRSLLAAIIAIAIITLTACGEETGAPMYDDTPAKPAPIQEMVVQANEVIDYYTSRSSDGVWFTGIPTAGISLSDIPPIRSEKAYNALLRQVELFLPPREAFGGNLWSDEQIDAAKQDKSYIDRYTAYFGENSYPDGLYTISGVPTQTLFGKLLTRAKEVGDVSPQVYVIGSEINRNTLYIDAAALTFNEGYSMIKLFDDAERVTRGGWGLTPQEIASSEDYMFVLTSYAYFDTDMFEAVYTAESETLRVNFKWNDGSPSDYSLTGIAR